MTTRPARRSAAVPPTPTRRASPTACSASARRPGSAGDDRCVAPRGCGDRACTCRVSPAALRIDQRAERCVHDLVHHFGRQRTNVDAFRRRAGHHDTEHCPARGDAVAERPLIDRGVLDSTLTPPRQGSMYPVPPAKGEPANSQTDERRDGRRHHSRDNDRSDHMVSVRVRLELAVTWCVPGISTALERTGLMRRMTARRPGDAVVPVRPERCRAPGAWDDPSAISKWSHAAGGRQAVHAVRTSVCTSSRSSTCPAASTSAPAIRPGSSRASAITDSAASKAASWRRATPIDAIRSLIAPA